MQNLRWVQCSEILHVEIPEDMFEVDIEDITTFFETDLINVIHLSDCEWGIKNHPKGILELILRTNANRELTPTYMT